MKILAIETSCDETAIAILECLDVRPASPASGRPNGRRTSIEPKFNLLSNIVLSQIKIHQPFGGVVPNLAMREHQKNLVPILTTALRDAKLLVNRNKKIVIRKEVKKYQPKLITNHYSLNTILEREQILLADLEKFVKKYDAPDIDAIAVTYGPGLEPALWVGINFAKALSAIWKKPLIPVNHLEGHIYASFLPETRENSKFEIQNPKQTLKDKTKKQKQELKTINYKLPTFPLLALVVSGGHTELVLVKKHLDYKILGETRDDAAGEAFDKVAKMLKLGYPGGPIISKLAKDGNPTAIDFPRPMINSNDFDFSFSGLKTSVLYHLRDHKGVGLPSGSTTPKYKADIAASFEQAVVDVLVAKTARALKKYKVSSLVVGGGVVANEKLRKSLEYMIKLFPETKLYLSPLWLSGDNAAMIAVAGYFRSLQKKKPLSSRAISALKAEGNLKLSVVRDKLHLHTEKEAVELVLKSEKEAKGDKLFSGNLKTITKKFS